MQHVIAATPAKGGVCKRTIALHHRPDVVVAPYQLPHRSSRQREAHAGLHQQVPDGRALARLFRNCFKTRLTRAHFPKVKATSCIIVA